MSGHADRPVRKEHQACLPIMCHRYQQDCVRGTFEKFGSSSFVRCYLNSHVNARPCQDTTAIPGRNETLTFMKVLHMCIAAVLPTSPCSVCPRPFAFSCTFPMRASRVVHPPRNTHLPTPCTVSKNAVPIPGYQSKSPSQSAQSVSSSSSHHCQSLSPMTSPTPATPRASACWLCPAVRISPRR